jgi:hypothetical protein
MEWTDLAEDRDNLRAVVNMVMKFFFKGGRIYCSDKYNMS